MNAPPITAIGLRPCDQTIRVPVGFRLGCITCQLHICICGAMVDARGLHGLSCRKSGSRHTRHSQLNDLILRAVKRAQIPATKQPICLSNGRKKTAWSYCNPWKLGKPLAWDVTVADTYAASHLAETAESAGIAANKAAANKISKYSTLATTHHFVSISVETASLEP